MVETPVDWTALEDTTLLRLVDQGRAKALSELYDRYGRLIFSVALQIVGERATAEEITLDVFMLVWQKAALYRRERGKVTTWLTSICRNRAIDALRRQGSRPEQRSVSWAEVSPVEWTAVAGTEGNPEEATDLSLQRGRVRSAIAQLPAEQQQALALAYFKGYTQREIAAALDQPLGTIKTRIRLAMQKLGRLLAEE